VIRQGTSLHDLRHDGVTLDFAYLETNQAVIDEDKFPRAHLGGETRVVHSGPLGSSIHHLGGKTKDVSGRDLAWSLTKCAQTDLWSLQILEDGERQVEFTADLLDSSDPSKSFFVRPV
jgi:hypothetical protein